MKFVNTILFLCLILCNYSVLILSGDSLKGIKMLMIVNRFPRISEGFILNQMKLFLDEGIGLDIIAEHGDQTSTTQKIVTDYDLMSKVHYINFKISSNHGVLKDLLLSKQWDIVYCQFEGIALDVAPLVCALENKPLLIAAVRGGDMDEKFEKRPDDYAYCFKNVDCFLPVCNFFKDKLVDFGCPYKKIIVQHSAIDLKLFPFQERKIINANSINIVSVARLVFSKGIQYGIEAIAKVHKQYPSITYTIIGGGKDKANISSGGYRSVLKRIIKDCKAESYIKLLGWKTREEISKIHKKVTNIFLLPSISHEGIPNALMEAMASGIPVISTCHNGIPELVEHGQRGLLAEICNADQLAEHIIYIIEHPEAVEQFTKAARGYVVKEHSTKFQNKKLLNLLHKMIKSHKFKKDLNKKYDHIDNYYKKFKKMAGLKK